jgi:hypothetical protein
MANTNNITADEIKPIFKSANVVTAANTGPASPERVMTINGVLFCLKPPPSNKQQGQSFVMPASSLDLFFSGIQPLT